jgi:hypothetical protein
VTDPPKLTGLEYRVAWEQRAACSCGWAGGWLRDREEAMQAVQEHRKLHPVKTVGRPA